MRTTRTPAARATEALGVADRKVARLTEATAKHAYNLRSAEDELEAAQDQRDYLATNPALRDVEREVGDQ